MKTKELEQYLNQLLNIHQFKDYAPNGLQIEGNTETRVIVSGVTASQLLIEEAIDLKADTILVHHGYFWPSEDPRLIGMKGKRIRSLIKNDINLMGYHLPLDAHPELGNNAILGKELGLKNIKPIQADDPLCLIFSGELINPISSQEFSKHLATVLGQTPIVSHDSTRIQNIAWCTGGAQSYLNKVIGMGFDAFISGEISEHTVHTARENHIVYFGAGHHATERYGIQALGAHLANQFEDLTIHFVDIPNPA